MKIGKKIIIAALLLCVSIILSAIGNYSQAYVGKGDVKPLNIKTPELLSKFLIETDNYDGLSYTVDFDITSYESKRIMVITQFGASKDFFGNYVTDPYGTPRRTAKSQSIGTLDVKIDTSGTLYQTGELKYAKISGVISSKTDIQSDEHDSLKNDSYYFEFSGDCFSYNGTRKVVKFDTLKYYNNNKETEKVQKVLDSLSGKWISISNSYEHSAFLDKMTDFNEYGFSDMINLISSVLSDELTFNSSFYEKNDVYEYNRTDNDDILEFSFDLSKPDKPSVVWSTFKTKSGESALDQENVGDIFDGDSERHIFARYNYSNINNTDFESDEITKIYYDAVSLSTLLEQQ